MTDQSKKQLAFAVCEFLQENIQDGTIAEDNQESIQVAIQCISDAFNFDLESDKSLSIHPQSLQSLFSVFLKTQSNLKKTVPQKKKVPEQKPINKELAEDLKSQGNKLLAAKDFHAAIEKYTEAIDNDGTNAVYFANRAAAYSQAGDHTAAAIDARTALEVNPDYSKAYSRLGHAEFCLGNFEAAVDAYTKGLEREPNNASIKQSLAAAKQRLGSAPVARSTPAANPLAGLGGMGGMPDMSQMMNDPNFMSMAQNFMSNPAMANMLNNPAMQNMMNQMKNGGGMPDIASLMSNPDMMNMANDLMKDPAAMESMMKDPNVAKLADQFGVEKPKPK